MKRKRDKPIASKGECSQCGMIAVILESHKDRYHKVCGNSVKGLPRNTHGRWR